MQLEVINLTHRYGAKTVVAGVDFGLSAGEIGCLLGASGCGKTTILRCIAGLETISGGEIRIAEKLVAAPGRQLPPERRGVAIVFQDHALFPHLSAQANVEFGLHTLARAERRARAEEALALMDLAAYGAAFPHEMSGGQQQRVALARALAPNPRLLLLDEPFASLDAGYREALATRLQTVLRELRTTTLMVTHDQREAFAIADRIGVMAAGRLLQWAPPADVYRAPATRRVAAFAGRGRFIRGRRIEGDRVDTVIGVCPARFHDVPATGSACDVLLRPEDLRLSATAHATAIVSALSYQGDGHRCVLRLDAGAEIEIFVPLAAGRPAPGDSVNIELAGTRLNAFKVATEKAAANTD